MSHQLDKWKYKEDNTFVNYWRGGSNPRTINVSANSTKVKASFSTAHLDNAYIYDVTNDEYLWKYKYSHFKYNGIPPQNEITLEYTTSSDPDNPNQKNVPSIALSIADALKACHYKKDNTITWIFS